MDEEKIEYSGYNSMAREPLMCGIPIIPLVLLLCLILITFALGIILFGFLKSFIMPVILLFVLFYIRFKCEDDSRAMGLFLWDIKGLFLRLSSGSFIISFTSTFDSNKRREKNVNEWFKNIRNTK